MDYCTTNGISHNFSAQRTPQQNGVVERKNRTLEELTRIIVRLFVEAISSLSGFDGFQTDTTETNEFCLMFYEFYILRMSLTSLSQWNTSKSVSTSPMKYSGTTEMFT